MDPKEIMQSLLSPDPEEAKRAIRTLHSLPGEVGLQPIAAALLNLAPGVREEASRVLRESGNEGIADQAIEGLRDPGDHVRLLSTMILGAMQWRPAVPALMEAARHEDAVTRQGALIALLQIGAPEARELYLSALHDEEYLVRMAGALGISRSDPRTALTVISQGLVAPDARSRHRATGVLRQLASASAAQIIAGSLRDPDPTERLAAILGLGDVGGEVAARVLTEALGEVQEPLPRCAILLALGWTEAPDALDPLSRCLRDRDPLLRYYAAVALGEAEDPAVVEPLVAAAGDSDAQVRCAVARGLAGHEDSRAVSALARLLSDRVEEVREEAAGALGRTDLETPTPHLIEALHDESPKVRVRAAVSLGRAGGPKAVDALCKALQDRAPEVRREAADSLGQIGHKRAVADLANALSDPEPIVRRAVARALGAIGGNKAVAALRTARRDKDARVRDEVEEALEYLRHGSANA